MAVLRIIGRLLVVAGIAFTVSACAQKREEVAVGVGTSFYKYKDAKPYAALYKPYAEMAAVAYSNPQFLDGRGCPDPKKFADPKLVDSTNTAEDNALMAGWLADLKKNWRCESGHVGPYGCKAGTPRCVEGLEYHVWRRGCREAVIAFRGTDFNEIGDWLSNFRWFVSRSLFDQYDQVQDAVPHIIDAVYRPGCRPSTIIATGHSLGGGLAQHAAYADSRIGYVYAFDPSPVTAFFAIPFPERSVATRRLGVDRIYQSGEILSLPRYLASGVFPSSPCQPRVRIVRFSTVLDASLIERHRIRNMTKGLSDLSAPPPPVTERQKPTGFANARNCDFAGNDPEMR
jgi:hypothetical protein